ncbi:hypothetical protein [Pedobacter jeongneungensis]|uniref:hypothetical protein n=1 Tax=Pedobacter jeongneungensis TaxID=947309 RepID=UPI00046905E2|nr:hypothetical protein [Pedobacter jeongneungensis]
MNKFLSDQPVQVLSLSSEYYIAVSKLKVQESTSPLWDRLRRILKAFTFKAKRTGLLKSRKSPKVAKREFRPECGMQAPEYCFDYDSLKIKIIARWPEAVQDVIMESEKVYLVICKPGICFFTFRRVFPQFVPRIIQQENDLEFKVYNASFNSDFIVRLF